MPADTLGSDQLRATMTEDEWRARVNCAALYRLVALYGWDDLIFTHISMRVPGPDHHFLINPYGFFFEEITASSLVKVDIDGQIVAPTPYFINPAGFTIHSAIHAAREDAKCVIHLHTDAGVAISAQKGGLRPLTQTAMAVSGDLAYHDYEGIALDLDERERLVADLGAHHVMLLRNHGTLAIGESAAQAFLRIYFLERACAMQALAMAGGADLLECAPDLEAKVGGQSNAGFAMIGEALAWPALLRRLDRKSPGYDA